MNTKQKRKTFHPISQAEKLLFSTTRIEGTLVGGGRTTGTGFFFSFNFGEDQVLDLLVTNKHVVEGVKELSFLFHLCDHSGALEPSGVTVPISIPNPELLSFWHPDNDIDLCAFGIKPFLDELSKKKLKPFFAPFSNAQIPTDNQLKELNAVESILMYGYPNGLWDEENNLPLIRRGITASHPFVDFNGAPNTLVDVACFPGSSGSPVVVCDEGLYSSKTGVALSNRLILLGALYAGPIFNSSGSIEITPIPTRLSQCAEFEIEQMMHLGYIVKSVEIETLADSIVKGLKIGKSQI